MTEKELFHDATSGVSLSEATDDDNLELRIDDKKTMLSFQAARELAKALYSATNFVPDSVGSHYQIYYVHETTDDNGEVVQCPELGPDDGDWRYTWDEPTLEDVEKRLRKIGQLVENLHRSRVGSSVSSDDDAGRAWVSVFKMPEDERVWKGYWDDFNRYDIE